MIKGKLAELYDKFDAQKKNLFSKPLFNTLANGSRIGPLLKARMDGRSQDDGCSKNNRNRVPAPSTVSVFPNYNNNDEGGRIPTMFTPVTAWLEESTDKFFRSRPGCKDGDSVLTRFAPSNESRIQVIEWNMLDIKKFYPLSMTSSFFIRCALYPLTLVKTKIQIQERVSIYRGTWDCFKKTYRNEGIRGLYRGFWISIFQIVSGVFYVSTYEGVRHHLREQGIKDSNIRALVAGACASAVGQTIIVPFDVISQHMMIVGMRVPGGSIYNPLGINYEGRSKLDITKAITREIYNRDGLRGFYRGYMASLATYVPNSALWWAFYQMYQDELIKVVPPGSSHLAVQCLSAMLGGWTTTILTNPLDVCRARLQVQRLPSLPKTFSILWKEESYRIFTKGLSARLAQSGVFSTFIILGYETIKRFSLSEEFRGKVPW